MVLRRLLGLDDSDDDSSSSSSSDDDDSIHLDGDDGVEEKDTHIEHHDGDVDVIDVRNDSSLPSIHLTIAASRARFRRRHSNRKLVVPTDGDDGAEDEEARKEKKEEPTTREAPLAPRRFRNAAFVVAAQSSVLKMMKPSQSHDGDGDVEDGDSFSDVGSIHHDDGYDDEGIEQGADNEQHERDADVIDVRNDSSLPSIHLTIAASRARFRRRHLSGSNRKLVVCTDDDAEDDDEAKKKETKKEEPTREAPSARSNSSNALRHFQNAAFVVAAQSSVLKTMKPSQRHDDDDEHDRFDDEDASCAASSLGSASAMSTLRRSSHSTYSGVSGSGGGERGGGIGIRQRQQQQEQQRRHTLQPQQLRRRRGSAERLKWKRRPSIERLQRDEEVGLIRSAAESSYGSSSRRGALAREARTKYSMGLAYSKCRDHFRARQCLLGALEVNAKQKFGSDCLDVAVIHEKLGDLARDRGIVTLAEHHYKEALHSLSECDCGRRAERYNPPKTQDQQVGAAALALGSEASTAEVRGRLLTNLLSLYTVVSNNGDSDYANAEKEIDERPQDQSPSPQRDEAANPAGIENEGNLKPPAVIRRPKLERRASLLSVLTMSTVKEEENDEQSLGGFDLQDSEDMSTTSNDLKEEDVRRWNSSLSADKEGHVGMALRDGTSSRSPVKDSSAILEKPVPSGMKHAAPAKIDAAKPPRWRQGVQRTTADEKFRKGIELYERGDYVSARMWFLAYLVEQDLATSAQGRDIVGLTDEKIGHCESRIGRHETAQAHYQAALSVFLPKRDERFQDAARVTAFSGDAHYASGKYDRALVSYKDCLSIVAKFLPEEDSEVAEVTNKMIRAGNALCTSAYARKDYKLALFHRRELLRLFQSKICNGDTSQVACYTVCAVKQLVSINYLLVEMKEYKAALKSLSETEHYCHLTPRLSVLTPKKGLDVLLQARTSVHQLRGYVFEQTGRMDNARIQYESAVALSNEAYGDTSEASAGALLRLGRFHAQQGIVALADEAFNKASDIIKASELKGDCEHLMCALDVAAASLARNGDTSNALVCLEEKLRLSRKFRGEDSDLVGEDHYRLGSLLAVTGDHHGAVPHLKRALGIKRQHRRTDQDIILVHRCLARSENALRNSSTNGHQKKDASIDFKPPVEVRIRQKSQS